jgi:hypothetical protein
MTEGQRPIVIVGLPRSGTTWTMQALGTSPGTCRSPEADNEDTYPAAIHAKRRLGRYPVLGPDDHDRAYHHLWQWILLGAGDSARSRRARQLLGPGGRDRIFEGKRDIVTWMASALARNPRLRPRLTEDGQPARVIAKSIHAQLALEWIASQFEVDVLVLLRHPASVLASWMELNLKDSRNSTLETRPEIRRRYLDPWGVPLPGPDPIERMSWRIGLLTAALEESAARHPEWHVRTHESLCVDPIVEFGQLYRHLGLRWTENTVTYLHDHNAPGEGFRVIRVAAEQADSWHRRLDDDQLATLRRVLGRFPISTWSDGDYERPVGGPV